MDKNRIKNVFLDIHLKTAEAVNRLAEIVPNYKRANAYSARGMLNNSLALMEALEAYEQSS